MSTGHLHIDLTALAANWRALDAKTNSETAAVVKADGYGLGAVEAAKTLAGVGARRFFVAVAEEGVAIRKALGAGFEINVFGGHMDVDAKLLAEFQLTPMLNCWGPRTTLTSAAPVSGFMAASLLTMRMASCSLIYRSFRCAR